MADNKPKDPGSDQSQARPQGDKPDQGAQGSNAGHYTGFLNAPPESNVFPAGSPQSDRGAAESMPGGTVGGAGAGGRGGLSGAAGGGRPGTSDQGVSRPGGKGGAGGAAGGSYTADVNVNSADSDMKGSGSADDSR
ncbi:hypothetical protein [Massilia niastensis]|uniref:hypothetical protein n=1 Tax=Massilia niastensis TaxID=544911 RepID=UPI0003A14A48|nr:hypothetical protein [Massilia niastensis]